MQTGKHNDITDVTGIEIGQVHQEQAATGVTIIKPTTPCVCAVDVRGGGPGTRESDALAPEALTDRVDAVVLSGGSVYGLAAADEVAKILGSQGMGFSLTPNPEVPVSPIVPAAILYDLNNEGDKSFVAARKAPYRALAGAAFEKISSEAMQQGRAGAGYGARAGAYQGGIGSASLVTEDGWEIGAVAAVNSFGSPYMPYTDVFWSWPFEMMHEGELEFGGRKPDGNGKESASRRAPRPRQVGFPPDTKLGQPNFDQAAIEAGQRQNTTICAIAVNATLTKAEARRVAIMAQDGLARAIRPAHAPTDGDVVFCLATGQKDLNMPVMDITLLGNMAADVLARAIARGVYEARS